jgi:hypothetical protein
MKRILEFLGDLAFSLYWTVVAVACIGDEDNDQE